MPRCNGSYIGVDANPNANVASGIWTVREAETYLRANKWPATPTVPSAPTGTAGDGQVSLTWTAPTGGSTPTDYEVQYSSNGGSTWTTFSDGVSSATSAIVTGLTNGTGYIFRVKAVNILGDGPYGSASGTVTPAALNVALLLHFDGSNGSTTFTDSSPNARTVTAGGGASISTAESKFGGASGYFDGNGDYLLIDADTIDFDTGDFTVECWVRPTSPPFTDSNPYELLIANDTSSGFASIINEDGTVTFGESLVSNLYTTSNAVAFDDWNHIAWTREGGTLRMFINGDLGFSGTHTTDIPAGDIRIGVDGNSTNTLPLTGYMDELRIVVGTAVYTANFTPPTAPF